MSYSRRDRAHAEQLARVLGDRGWSVFWDKALQAGESFDQVLAEQLASAAAVVVLWSPSSVDSDWVLDEAQQAKDRGVLVPVLIEDVALPLGFGRLQTADLIGWKTKPGHPGLIELEQALGRIIDERPADAAGTPGRTATSPVPEQALTGPARPRLLVGIASAVVVVALGLGLLIALTGGDDESVGASGEPGGPTTTPADANTSTMEEATTAGGDSETVLSASGEPLLPSAAGMANVTVSQPIIGYGEYAAATDPERYRPEQALPEGMDFYVDKGSTSNAFFREWLIYEAGNDLDKWRPLAPQSWIDGPDNGFPTYPDGQNNEPVVGVSRESASAYCRYVNKRLVTEIEWELAATDGAFVPDSVAVQNWVDAPADYGPVGPSSMVLRGNFGTEEQNDYYRTIAPDSPVFRTYAGVRCASDLTRPERLVASNDEIFFADDFNDLDSGWPSTPSDGDSSVGYHPTDVFHVETERSSTQVMIVGPEPAPANSTVETEVELRKPADGFGQFRYGLVARASDEGYLILTVWPEVDGETRYVNWCLAQSGESLLGPDERVGSRNGGAFTSACPDKLDEGRHEVETFSSRLSLTLVENVPAVTIDGTELELAPGIAVGLPAGRFGFYVESFSEDRVAHLHYDGLLVTSL